MIASGIPKAAFCDSMGVHLLWKGTLMSLEFLELLSQVPDAPECAGGALATLAPLLVRTLGTVGLLALGWRQRGIIRRLGLQGRDLFHLR
jgi:hypothetical protein